MALFKRSLSSFNLRKAKEESKTNTDKFSDINIAECSTNVSELNLMHWIFNQEHAESELNSKTHIKRISRSDSRERPNWITSYYEKEKTLLIWILGTENSWDWTNLLNVCHKEVTLQYPTRRNISVHKGVYKALNNICFYAPLFADVYMHFNDTDNQSIERVIVGGHSQVSFLYKHRNKFYNLAQYQRAGV